MEKSRPKGEREEEKKDRDQQDRKSWPETASAIGAVSPAPDCLSPGAGLLSHEASCLNTLISLALSYLA